ncbi:hypothetical protein CRUP_027556, partial [Coryphaenoides rupestris]
MADTGGVKAKLQYQWTSQFRARLFCGDQAQRRHYPELVDVAFHCKEDGEFSRVYALFRNEWRMTAVCVYSMESIQKVFKTSEFKGNKESIPKPRPGTADTGGVKAKLQYQWTSQFRARLFCGDQAQRRHYPELVDVAFHCKEDGEFSRVYALFRNEWRMTAVCVYSMESIQKVFKTSEFKGNKESIPKPRPGT